MIFGQQDSAAAASDLTPADDVVVPTAPVTTDMVDSSAQAAAAAMNDPLADDTDDASVLEQPIAATAPAVETHSAPMISEPEVVEPEAPASEPEPEEVADPAPAVPEEPKEEPAEIPVPSVFATSVVADDDGDDDLLALKQQALSQLSPLVDHLDQTPEEKFRTTMMMIQSTDNQALIKDAYAAAQAITDDKVRAQALLDVVNEINYFTQQKQQ